MKHLTPEENKLVDEYWNEHDGTHFYKDELKEMIVEIKHNVVEETEKKWAKYIIKIQENIEAGGANENLTLATILCSELRMKLNPNKHNE